MEFYKIWQTRSGLIGVNKLTLGDLIGVNIVVFFILMILVALLVAFFPIMFFVIYLLLMIGFDGSDQHTPTRLGINIVTVITTIYFLFDYHFGWYSHKILASSMYAETYDALAIRNLSIAMMSILLFFVGHEFYRVGGHRVVRVVVFSMVLYFGFGVTNKISTAIITNSISQYNTPELTQERVDLKAWDDDNYGSDEQRLQDKIDALEKEQKEIQRNKDFDDNFVRDYLTH
jgi:hypothetical protein